MGDNTYGTTTHCSVCLPLPLLSQYGSRLVLATVLVLSSAHLRCIAVAVVVQYTGTVGSVSDARCYTHVAQKVHPSLDGSHLIIRLHRAQGCWGAARANRDEAHARPSGACVPQGPKIRVWPAWALGAAQRPLKGRARLSVIGGGSPNWHVLCTGQAGVAANVPLIRHTPSCVRCTLRVGKCVQGGKEVSATRGNTLKAPAAPQNCTSFMQQRAGPC